MDRTKLDTSEDFPLNQAESGAFISACSRVLNVVQTYPSRCFNVHGYKWNYVHTNWVSNHMRAQPSIVTYGYVYVAFESLSIFDNMPEHGEHAELAKAIHKLLAECRHILGIDE